MLHAGPLWNVHSFELTGNSEMCSSAVFEFVRDPHSDNVRLLIKASVASRDELFDAYATNLAFPSYFGRNWDAFVDCLSDLSWIDEAEVTVAHESLPSLQTKDLNSYLECLRDVLARSRRGDRSTLLQGSGQARDRRRAGRCMTPLAASFHAPAGNPYRSIQTRRSGA